MNDATNETTTTTNGEGADKKERTPKTPEEQKAAARESFERAARRFLQHHSVDELFAPIVDATIREHGFGGFATLRALGVQLSDPLAAAAAMQAPAPAPTSAAARTVPLPLDGSAP